MQDPKEILRKSKKILLVDWPHPGTPRALLRGGFIVFCYSPNGYTKPELVDEYPQDANQKNIFPPKNKDDGYLVFRPLKSAPDSIDIVNVYRPEEEHEKIINNQVLPLKAKYFWLQPPIRSSNTKSLADRHGLIFIEGVDIAEIAMGLSL